MEKQIQYSYAKIDLEQFAMFEENYEPSIKEVEFRTELQFSYDQEQAIICNSIVLNIIQGEKSLLKADQRSYFRIEPNSIELLKGEDGIIEFSPQLLVQFASLNYGSMRGTIHIKTLGTAINKLILPPVYFHKMINNSFRIK